MPSFGLVPPDVPVSADEPALRPIRPERDAPLLPLHPFLLLPFPFVLPLNLLPSLIRLTVARCKPRGRG